MTSLAALTCLLPGPGAQLGAPKMAAAVALPAPGGGVGTEALRACALPGLRPLLGVCAPSNSRESGVCLPGRAVVLTFRHGVEGGEGRWRLCEGSAQAGTPLPFLGGESRERAAWRAAFTRGPRPSAGLDGGGLRSQSVLEPDWLQALRAGGERAACRY